VQTPTFSIVVETENLANGELSDLESCLASIVAQDLQTHRPNEVILVDSGQIDAGILDDIRARYPWIRVHVSSTPLHYYDAKMLGAQLATGELIAFADSDMVYEKGWLRGQLALFERQEVDFVSGETRVEISGPYTFSVATTWLFPVTYSPAHCQRPPHEWLELVPRRCCANTASDCGFRISGPDAGASRRAAHSRRQSSIRREPAESRDRNRSGNGGRCRSPPRSRWQRAS
jgi:glycosyltransferase involved in cell wall biosynthesis